MNADQMEISLSKLDLSLAHLRQCPERMIKEMISSLEKRGQINPVIVAGDSKHMTLVDGFKRYQAFKAMDIKTILVRILPISGANMKAHLYILNQSNGFSFIEECLLIRELIRKEGLMQKDVGLILQHHKSWVSRRYSIICNLDKQLVEDIRVGLIPSGSGQILARLPQNNQVDLSAAIQRDSLKINEIKRLIDLWFKTDDPEFRKFLINSSKEALKLSTTAPIEKIDQRIPEFARGFYKSVIKLKKSATLLKNKSKRNFDMIPPDCESILKIPF